MFRRTTVLAVTLALAGCAQGQAQSASRSPDPTIQPSSPATSPSAALSTPTPTTTRLPTEDRRPSGPPKGPTDTIKKTTWVVGTVTTGGNGPCYGLTTDDGVKYALHGTNGTTLTKGTRVQVNTAVSRLKIDCGPGKLVEMVVAQPIR